MRKKRPAAAVLWFCILLLLIPAGSVYGDPALDDAQKLLLQKSLTIYEIDQELQRLTEQENRLNDQIRLNSASIENQQQLVEETRKHAGNTLRAYYMGDRDAVWLLLFSASSFSDALKLIDYLQMILDNDQHNLKSFQTAYQELQESRQQLLQTQQKLQQTKASFLAQRDRIEKLQRERDEQLAKEKDADRLIRESQQLVDSWATTGLPMFKSYFKQLSQAMGKLPQLFLEQKNQYLVLNGLDATFQITDSQLNDFLHKTDPNLQSLVFTFNENQMVISGKQDNLEIVITGHYTLEQKDNHTIILFHVDELKYNGYTLPDTTAKDLEKQFVLGFYPQDFASFLDATKLTMVKGKLTIQLKLKF